MTWLRWLLVVFAPAAVAILTLLFATLLYQLSNTLCDPVFLVAGKCVEPWHTTAVETIIHSAIILIVIGIILLPAAIAPRFKKTIALVGYTLATLIFAAAYFTSGWSDLLSPLLLTLLTGGTCALWVWKNERSNNNV